MSVLFELVSINRLYRQVICISLLVLLHLHLTPVYVLFYFFSHVFSLFFFHQRPVLPRGQPGTRGMSIFSFNGDNVL